MSSSEGAETTPSVEPKQLRVFPSLNGQLQSDCDDQNGRLTLTIASYNGDAGRVKSLLEIRAMLRSMVATTSILGQITAALEYQHAFDCVVPSEERGRMAVLNAVAGRTPLTCAVDGGHTAVVGLLLESDEDVDEKDRDGMAPIHWAAYHGHAEMVDLLLQKGANIEAVNSDLHTPLFLAVREGHAVVVDLLLQKYKPNVNARDSKGNTPLMLLLNATAPGTQGLNSERIMIERLIQAGADNGRPH